MIDKAIDKLSRKVLGKHGIVSVHEDGGRIVVGTTRNVHAVAPRVPHMIDGYRVWITPASPIIPHGTGGLSVFTAPNDRTAAQNVFGKYGISRSPGRTTIDAGRLSLTMSGMGDDTIPTMNTDAVRAYMVGPSSTDWYLDAALVPHGIDSAASARVPAAVKQVLESTGAKVATAKWGSVAEGDAGKIYVVWKPDKQYNAVDYANIAVRLFRAAAEGLTSGAQIAMPRYRVRRVWPLSNLYVYPTGEGIPASAPELAKNTLPGDLPPDAPGSETALATDRTLATAVPIAAAVGGGLVLAGGLWWWLSRRSVRRVTTNRRKRMRRNPSEKSRHALKPFAVLCGSDNIVWTGQSAAEADRAIVRTTVDGVPARIAGCYVAKFNHQTWKYERHGRGANISARQLAWNGKSASRWEVFYTPSNSQFEKSLFFDSRKEAQEKAETLRRAGLRVRGPKPVGSA